MATTSMLAGQVSTSITGGAPLKADGALAQERPRSKEQSINIILTVSPQVHSSPSPLNLTPLIRDKNHCQFRFDSTLICHCTLVFTLEHRDTQVDQIHGERMSEGLWETDQRRCFHMMVKNSDIAFIFSQSCKFKLHLVKSERSVQTKVKTGFKALVV